MWCALTCRHRQRDPEAMQSLGGGGSGGALPQTSGKNAVCFTFYVAAVVKPLFPFFPSPRFFS
jgi:hypothetical protein